jgi:hypothetical protein
MAVAAGLFSLHLLSLLFPESKLFDQSVMDWYRVFAVALAMGLISVIMISIKSSHPPAAASALLAVMGYLDDPYKIAGIIAAVILLAIEGFFFNRVLGGLPYPVWRADQKVVRDYGILAGIPKDDEKFWEQLTNKIYQRR